MFKKDNFLFGCILGFLAPLAGLVLLKFYKFGMLSFKEVIQFIYYQPGHSLLTAGLTVSLMMNAFFFTMYINEGSDKTAKGIFATTDVYALYILSLKYFS